MVAGCGAAARKRNSEADPRRGRRRSESSPLAGEEDEEAEEDVATKPPPWFAAGQQLPALGIQLASRYLLSVQRVTLPPSLSVSGSRRRSTCNLHNLYKCECVRVIPV